MLLLESVSEEVIEPVGFKTTNLLELWLELKAPEGAFYVLLIYIKNLEIKALKTRF